VASSWFSLYSTIKMIHGPINIRWNVIVWKEILILFSVSWHHLTLLQTHWASVSLKSCPVWSVFVYVLIACVFVTRDTVRHPRRFVFGKFVRKPNCSWSEAFVNRGLTVYWLTLCVFFSAVRPWKCRRCFSISSSLCHPEAFRLILMVAQCDLSVSLIQISSCVNIVHLTVKAMETGF